MLKDKIEALKAQIADLKAENEEALEALRIKYLSKKGEVTALFNEFREVAPEEKRELGQRLNELKNLATEKINALREATKQQAKEQNKIDITRPAFPAELGTRHPISVVRKQIIDIFSRLGFTIAEGLMMGTRSGDVDPGALLFLMEKYNLTPAEMLNIINKKSGVLGITGLSSDMRDVVDAAEEKNDKRAQLALDMYELRILKYIGAYAA